MKVIHWSLVVFAVATAGVVVGANGVRPEPSRVAVCNVRKVMVEYPRFVALKQRVDAEEKKATDDIRRRSDMLDQKLKQLSELKRGSPDYQKLDEECWRDTFEARSFQEVEKNRLERARRDGLLDCYQDIVAEVAAYAKENGIDVVQYVRDIQFDQALTVADLETMITSNTVLYSDPKADITSAVAERLNAKFKASGTGAVVPPSVPPAPAPVAPAPAPAPGK